MNRREPTKPANGTGEGAGLLIEAGTVWFDCQLALYPQVPFGGYKQSGWGRGKAWEGLDGLYADQVGLCRHIELIRTRDRRDAEERLIHRT